MNLIIRYACTLVLVILIPATLTAQKSKIETLKEELKNNKKQDTVRASILYDLAFAHFSKDMEITQTYLKEAEFINNKLDFKRGKAGVFYLKGILESRQSNYEKGDSYFYSAMRELTALNDNDGIASINNALGVNSYQQSQYDKALGYFKKNLTYYKSTFSKDNMLACLLNMGNIYAETGRYNDAIINYKQVVVISEKIDDEYGKAYALSNLGHVYEDQGNFPLALENYNKGYALKEKAADTLGMSITLNSIGNIYADLEKYDKSLYYFNKSLQLQEKIGNKSLIAVNKGNIGGVYKNKKQYDKALQFMNESLKLSLEINEVRQASNCYNTMGQIYLLLNNPNKALENFEKGNKISLEIGDQSALAISYLGIAETYLSQKNYTKALAYGLKGDVIAKELELLEAQKEAAALLAEVYKNTGDYEKAFASHEQFKTLNDSLFNKENIEKITQLEYEYKYKQVLDSASIRELKLTKTVTDTSKDLEKSKQNYLWAIIGILLISMLLGSIIFFLKFRNVKSKNDTIIMEQRLLRSQMTPHFVFNSLSILQGMMLNKEVEKSISYLSKFSKLLRITLENSRDKMVLLEQELKAVDNYLSLQNLENNSYNYRVEVSDSVDVKELMIPPMLIQPFAENAIEHAFTNQQDYKQIDIHLSLERNQLICTITDNGVGINNNEHCNRDDKKSLATKITAERLELVSKAFNMKGAVTIENREKYGAQGTLVTLLIPFKKVTDS